MRFNCVEFPTRHPLPLLVEFPLLRFGRMGKGERDADDDVGAHRTARCLLRERAPVTLPFGDTAVETAVAILRALTPRQRQVAELTACGLSAREIGARLWVTEKTARYHQSAITRKTGMPLSSVAGMVYAAHLDRCPECSAG